MKWIQLINWGLLILLGLATGIVKVLGQPDDVRIFGQIGFSYGATVAFGAVQAVAALLLLLPKTLKIGAVVLAISFCIATLGLFVDQKTTFGIVSLLFIAMAAWNIFFPAGNPFVKTN